MSNPFDDPRGGSSRKALGLDPVTSYTTSDNIEDQVVDYEKEIEKYMQKSLDSTGRSVQQLDNSERLANATAQDLLAQREKLERSERGLDEIHRTTQLTQRSLNSLKSVFGGFFKNKFSKAPPLQNNVQLPKSDSKLTQILENSQSGGSSSGTSVGGSAQPTLSEQSRANIKGTRWEAMDKEIDQNLGDMSSSLARLRQMGAALGDEIEEQNKILDRIHQKAERNDTVVRHQDNQMKQLLGYKN